jgi:2-amino-4-hydroxy-6-hydroxymethyldihydropteridine diphosphokinase
LILETQFSPDEILDKIIFIEKQLGRIKKTNPDQVYQSRKIDIDILLFNDEIIDETNLKIPHVHLHERLFVLMPLSEIAGELEHPVLKKKIKELLYDQLLVH